MEVHRHARLYTTEIQIHKIVTYADNPRMEGQVLGIPVRMKTRLGDRKVAIPIDVTLKAYIDLNKFGPEQVERTDSTITLTLPDPEITLTASKVDHKATRQFVDLTRSSFSDDELTELARQGRDTILSHTSQYGLIERAERDAAALLIPIVRRMGFKEEAVTVRFRKDFSDGEILQLIKQ